jgi:hypothetical protein
VSGESTLKLGHDYADPRILRLATETLPKSYGTCLYFTLEELEGLRGSPTFISAIKVIATVAIQYTYIHDLFQVRPSPPFLEKFAAS